MGKLDFLAPILGGLGQGIAQLPQVRRQRRMDDADLAYRDAQMRNMDLESRLAEEQLGIQREQAAQAEALRQQQIEESKFNMAFKTHEALPGGTPMSGGLLASAEKYGFPTTQFNLPSQIPLMQGGQEMPMTPEQQAAPPITRHLSKPFEGPRLLQEFYRQQGATQRNNATLAFRQSQLTADTRIRDTANALRARGIAVSEAQLAQRIAESTWEMNDQAFDNAVNAYNAALNDPTRQAQAMQSLFGQGGGASPAVSPLPPLPTPPTPAAPQRNPNDTFGLLN